MHRPEAADDRRQSWKWISSASASARPWAASSPRSRAPSPTAPLESCRARTAAAGHLLRARRRPRLRRLRRGHPRPRHPRQLPDLDPAQIPMAAPVTAARRCSTCSIPSAPAAARALRSPTRSIRALRFALPITSSRASSCPSPRRSSTRTTAWCSPSASSISGSARSSWCSGTVQIWPGMPVAAGRSSKTSASSAFACSTRASTRPAIPTPVHARHGHARRAHRRRRRSGRRRRPPARRALRHARGHHQQRVGRRHEDGRRAAAKASTSSPAPCSTPSATPSRRSSASSTCIPTASRRSASSCRPGSTTRCAPPTATCSTSCMHPYLWRYLEGGTLRSWGAKSLQESGRRGEPYLAGDGYARIGEGSGSTNVLTGSGVDEAWTTGAQLAEGVIELLQAGKPFTRENLERAYVRAAARVGWKRKAASPSSARRIPARRRDAACSAWRWPGSPAAASRTARRAALRTSVSRPSKTTIAGQHPARGDRRRCASSAGRTASPLHDALMDRCGWPPIPFDGKLLVSHQDALLMGGKVQAPAGYADHVVFLQPGALRDAATPSSASRCAPARRSRPATDGVPAFDREKCVHCGACLWNCAQTLERRRAPISNSAPAPAACTRRELNQWRGSGSVFGRCDWDFETETETMHFQIVVCGSIVPDPLQTLEPVTRPRRPGAEERNDAARGARSLGRPRALRSRAPGRARTPAARSGWSASARRPSCSR